MTYVALITARNEDMDLVERIGDRLQKAFGHKNVTFIEPGTPFSPAQLARRTIVLLPLSEHAADDMAQLAHPDNPATQVLQAALTQQLPILPILLKGAQMPRVEAWPASLRAIANNNAVIVRGTGDFPNDSEQLIRAIKYVEHLRPDEMVDIVPTTPTQAFIQTVRLPRSRRAFAVLGGALSVGLASIALTSGLVLQPPSSSPSPLIPFTQVAANVLATVGIGLGLVWLFPAAQTTFSRSLMKTLGCLVGLILLPGVMVILATLPAINGDGFVLDDYLSYNYDFSLLTPILLPKVIALISGVCLGIFIWRTREHWITTLLAGIAVIIFPLLGANWAQPAFVVSPIFVVLSVGALATLMIATLLAAWRAIRLQRWCWLAALIALPIVALVSILFTQQSIFFAYSMLYAQIAAIPFLLAAWTIIAPVLINTVWPITVLLAPWLMGERVKR